MALPAPPTWGTWSVRFSTLVTALTVIGLAGALIDLAGLFIAKGPVHVGCGAGIGVMIMVGIVALILIGLAFVGILAIVGIVFLYMRSNLGPLLLVPVNVLVIGFFGWWRPVYPGQVLWAAALVLLAAAPALATALLMVQLMTRGRLWVRLVEAVVIVALGLPLVALFAFGITEDVLTGLQPPPAPVVALSSGPAC